MDGGAGGEFYYIPLTNLLDKLVGLHIYLNIKMELFVL